MAPCHCTCQKLRRGFPQHLYVPYVGETKVLVGLDQRFVWQHIYCWLYFWRVCFSFYFSLGFHPCVCLIHVSAVGFQSFVLSSIAGVETSFHAAVTWTSTQTCTKVKLDSWLHQRGKIGKIVQQSWSLLNDYLFTWYVHMANALEHEEKILAVCQHGFLPLYFEKMFLNLKHIFSAGCTDH